MVEVISPLFSPSSQLFRLIRLLKIGLTTKSCFSIFSGERTKPDGRGEGREEGGGTEVEWMEPDGTTWWRTGEGAAAGARPGGWRRRTSGVPSAGAALRLKKLVHRRLGLEISFSYNGRDWDRLQL